MSGNSCCSALQTAPIVTAFWRGRSSVPVPSASTGSIRSEASMSVLDMSVAGQEGELIFADLQLVPIGELVRLDPPPVHVCPVQRAAVVEVVVAAASDEHRVVAGNRDVVEEDVAVRPASDREAVAVERKALARASSPRADHERGSPAGYVAQIEHFEFSGLTDLVGGRRGPGRRLGSGEERPTALAVVGAVGIGKAALRAMLGHGAAVTPARTGGRVRPGCP